MCDTSQMTEVKYDQMDTLTIWELVKEEFVFSIILCWVCVVDCVEKWMPRKKAKEKDNHHLGTVRRESLAVKKSTAHNHTITHQLH